MSDQNESEFHATFAESMRLFNEAIESWRAFLVKAQPQPDPEPEPFKVGELVTEAMGEPPVRSVVMRRSGDFAWQRMGSRWYPTGSSVGGRTWAEVREGARLIHLGGSGLHDQPW